VLHSLSVLFGLWLLRLILAILGHEVIVDASVDLRFLRLVHHWVLDVYVVNHFLSLNVVKNGNWLLVLVEDVRYVFYVFLLLLLWGSWFFFLSLGSWNFFLLWDLDWFWFWLLYWL